MKKILAILCLAALLSCNKDNVIWRIGDTDGRPTGLALAPDGFRNFQEYDFGFEDKYYLVGHSSPEKDFPYVLPGPVDIWAGTWSTAGWRTHEIHILFGLDKKPSKGSYRLDLKLADYEKRFLPLVKVSVNSKVFKEQIGDGTEEFLNQKNATSREPVADTLSISGDFSTATPMTISLPLEAGDLLEGGNEAVITIIEGGWILFDAVELCGTSSIKVQKPSGVYARKVEAAEYQLDENSQALLVDLEHLDGVQKIDVRLDGKTILEKEIDGGRYCLEAPMPAVQDPVTSNYEVLCGKRKIASGKVERAPKSIQTPADYVDTRIGTGHSRWMIAPGPWMPFSMVKMAPDNQNSGWQSGYQPSFESVACFSHIHEWTLGGLGLMATNGPLMTVPGHEQKPDEGYRSRIDKQTEKAPIGYYSVILEDYGILAELTATTRCGVERFNFPADREGNRIQVDFNIPHEYRTFIRDAAVRRISDTCIEGECHLYSPGVWSRDADQDYVLHFVFEFDRPLGKMGCWKEADVTEDVPAFKWEQCVKGGFYVEVPGGGTVGVRTGISPVSIQGARENLQKEVTEPFGWDFDAVRENQKKVWNDIFERVAVKTEDRLEKVKFYNNMYRATCGRNIWSDLNGEWISTDGRLCKVADPSDDVMLGCDAFWNTFWNLNQYWNLVIPEWSSRWVRSQLSLYDANGWLAKGPAGLNYIPVMVAEHEIPLLVGACQMGIGGFDPEKVLQAAVKMQTTPGRKVFKGFAGNRDLAAYMKYHYVPYDLGRFSNTMEYSFDDWTVGQLAKALGHEDVYRRFNDRGYWWKNVIDDEGYCHMKDSHGNWMEDFDFFRSGANRHYVEGNAWQLTFFVPQDVPELVEMLGKDRFTERLEWGFNQDEKWRYNAPGDQYWDHPVCHGNQQSMHFAWLFNYAGQPWDTQKWSRSILDRYYGIGTGNAYLGDEDQGQMSAWAVMVALGLFQMDGGCSVEPRYEIGSPVFEEVVIDLGGRYGRGDRFVIKANGTSRKNIYVQSAKLNGKPLESFWFPASELLGGGTLELEMGPEPNKEWGLK
ncbi:MAG: GH92 family glycosyl hydrolase [Bacteroidales bacterium]|nr:GH92 family glycosyl hydrolase [Bacteroidales bacterium]